MTSQSRRTLWNLGTGYANLGVMAAVTLLLIPLYARLLDAQQWGIVATCMTLHGLLFAMDVALAPIVVRDVAQRSSDHQAARLRQRFLRLYMGCGLAAVAMAELVIAWRLFGGFSSRRGELELLWLPLQIALIGFLLQFANSALIGYWSGRHLQALANMRSAGFTLVKHACALSSVILLDRSATGYLLPIAIVSAVELLLNLRFIRRSEQREAVVAATNSPKFPESGLESPEAAVVVADRREQLVLLMTSSLLAVSVSQIDRVVLSATLSVAEFGRYYLLSYVIAALLTLQMPIARTFLPRIAESATPVVPLRAMYAASFWVLLLPCAAGIVLAPIALPLWLPVAGDASAAATPLRLMLLGVMLIVLFAPVSNYLFSRRRYGDLAVANGLALAVQVLILVTLSEQQGGLLAGGLAWLGCGAVLCVYGLNTIRSTPELSSSLWRRAG